MRIHVCFYSNGAGDWSITAKLGYYVPSREMKREFTKQSTFYPKCDLSKKVRCSSLGNRVCVLTRIRTNRVSLYGYMMPTIGWSCREWRKQPSHYVGWKQLFMPRVHAELKRSSLGSCMSVWTQNIPERLGVIAVPSRLKIGFCHEIVYCRNFRLWTDLIMRSPSGTVILQIFGALKFRGRAIAEGLVRFNFRCPWMLSWLLNVFFCF